MAVSSESVEKNTTTHETSQIGENECPECGAPLVADNHRAETYCEECGTVVSSGEIDHGPEWRNFDDPERGVGSPNTKLMHDDGIGGTRIGFDNTDKNGNLVSAEKRQQLSRLRKENRRSETASTKERNLRFGTGEIRRIGSALDLDEDIMETAAVIFRRASDEDLFVGGFSIEEMAAGGVYAAIKQIGIPVTLDAVVNVSRVGESRVRRGFSRLNRELGLEVKPQPPENFLPKLLSSLNDPSKDDDYMTASDEQELEMFARKILDKARDENLISGREPIGLAAAAIYTADTEQASVVKDHDATLTQAALSDLAGVSDVTVRSRYQEFKDFDVFD